MERRLGTAGSIIRVAAFALALTATYLGLIGTASGQIVDSGSFGALAGLNGAFGAEAGLVRVGGPVLLAVVSLAAGVVALVQRRWRPVLEGVAIVVLSVVVAEGVKLVLPRPDLGGHGYADNTFPSGHMVIATSLAIAVAVILPRRAGAALLSGLALVLAAVVGCASIVSFAHRPSDVVGAVLVVGAVTSCVLWRRRSAVARGPARAVLTAVAALCVAAAALAVAGGSGLIDVGAEQRTALEAVGWLVLCAALVGLMAATASDPRAPVSRSGSPHDRSGRSSPAPSAEPAADRLLD